MNDVDRALAHVRAAGIRQIDHAVILGSGLGEVVDELFEEQLIIPYCDLPGMPPTFVSGHRGELLVGSINGKRIAAFLGRAHLYQGVSPRDVVFPIRLAAACGVKQLVITNAAGGIDPAFAAGTLMLIRDHLNLTGTTPLNFSEPLGQVAAFVPMLDAYNPAARERMHCCAATLNIDLREGVYAGVLGPAYETPAEVAYLRMIGAHAVGMSTVLETIAARALDLEVLGLSLITNQAGTHAEHADVLRSASQATQKIKQLFQAYLQ